MPVEENPEKAESLLVTTSRTKRNDIDVAPLRGWGPEQEDDDNYGLQLRIKPTINVDATNQGKLSARPANIKINVSNAEGKSRNRSTMNVRESQDSARNTVKSAEDSYLKRTEREVSQTFHEKKRTKSLKPKAPEPDPTCGFKSTNKRVQESLKQVPRKFRA